MSALQSSAMRSQHCSVIEHLYYDQ